MENLTDEQRYLLYNLYSLVIHAQTTLYRYNEILGEKAVKGDVQASSMIMSNNLFINAAKDVLEDEQIKQIEAHIVETMYKFMGDIGEDEEREVN